MIGRYFCPRQCVIFMAGVLAGLTLGSHVESEPFVSLIHQNSLGPNNSPVF